MGLVLFYGIVSLPFFLPMIIIGADAPFPIIKDWSELEATITYYETHKEEMDKLQMRVVNWWKLKRIYLRRGWCVFVLMF